ncbi:MAG: hypothetical protein K0B02_04845 [DPANN group archaeon]|nr:hypothetical protein [DPANN group archaeon]
MPVIKSVDVIQLGKIFSAAYGFAVFLLFAFLGIPSLLIDYSMVPGFFLIMLVMPVMFGVLGFIKGVFIGVIYNFVASKIGGLRYEVSK